MSRITLLKALKIRRLKREACNHYEEYMRILNKDSKDEHFLLQLDNSLRTAREKFNAAMDELSRLDPDCPKIRL